MCIRDRTESIKYGDNIYRVSPGELTVQRSLRISGSAPHKFEPEKFRLEAGQSEPVTVAEFSQDVLKKVVAANRKVLDSRESARKKRIE